MIAIDRYIIFIFYTNELRLKNGHTKMQESVFYRDDSRQKWYDPYQLVVNGEWL